MPSNQIWFKRMERIIIAKKHRYYYKRYIDEAIGHIDNAINRIGQASLMTQDGDYHEHKVFLDNMAIGLAEAKYHLYEYSLTV